MSHAIATKRTDAVTSILHGTVDTYLHGTVQPNIDNLYGTVQTYMSGTAHEQLTLTGKSTHFDNDPTSTSRWTSSSRATDFPLTVTAAGFATRVAQPKARVSGAVGSVPAPARLTEVRRSGAQRGPRRRAPASKGPTSVLPKILVVDLFSVCWCLLVL